MNFYVLTDFLPLRSCYHRITNQKNTITQSSSSSFFLLSSSPKRSDCLIDYFLFWNREEEKSVCFAPIINKRAYRKKNVMIRPFRFRTIKILIKYHVSPFLHFWKRKTFDGAPANSLCWWLSAPEEKVEIKKLASPPTQFQQNAFIDIA
jgi:hypothetical protein